MTDLTAIEKPLGLLDAETQSALKAHGGPYEMLVNLGWGDVARPAWDNISTYRVKPASAPRKPRECWLTFYPRAEDHCGLAWLTLPMARNSAGDGDEVLRMREVTEADTAKDAAFAAMLEALKVSDAELDANNYQPEGKVRTMIRAAIEQAEACHG